MTQSNSDTHELRTDELDLISGGAPIQIGPISIDYSKGCGCVDISVGSGFGMWFGSGKFGVRIGESVWRL